MRAQSGPAERVGRIVIQVPLMDWGRSGLLTAPIRAGPSMYVPIEMTYLIPWLTRYPISCITLRLPSDRKTRPYFLLRAPLALLEAGPTRAS